MPGTGRVPAMVPGIVLVSVIVPVGSVKLVVVSALVFVAGATAIGGGSPGPFTVDELAVEVPSWTTSYCCWPRCMVLLRPHA